MTTRPTSDRLRETLFNVLGPRVAASHFADLYAGSGAVGIESLSRGAAQVFFAEKHAAAAAAIRANLRSLHVATGWQLEAGGTAALLKRLGASTGQVLLDIVFLDPPYEEAEEYQRTLTSLGSGVLLQEDAVVVAEHTRKQPLLDAYGLLYRTRTLLQGDAALSFYAVAPPMAALPETSTAETRPL